MRSTCSFFVYVLFMSKYECPFHYTNLFYQDYGQTHSERRRDRQKDGDWDKRLGKVWKQRQTRDRKNTLVNTLLLTACLWLDVFASWKLFCWVDRARNYSLLANSTLHHGRRLWEQHTTWALRLHIIQRERDSKNISEPYLWCVSTKLTRVAVLITLNIQYSYWKQWLTWQWWQESGTKLSTCTVQRGNVEATQTYKEKRKVSKIKNYIFLYLIIYQLFILLYWNPRF